MFEAHALAQAAQMPSLWASLPQQPHFTILCSRFGQGQAFAATLQAWRDCPQRPQRLVFVSSAARWPELAPPGGGAWPPTTRNLHLLDFEAGHVRLLLAVGLDSPWRQLRQVRADALWLDGRDFIDHDASARHAAAAMKAAARLAAPLAQLGLWQATAAQQDALRAAGFVFATESDGVQLAQFRPRFVTTAAAVAPRAPGHAVVLGAGIAGACAAAALAQRGWRCTVLDAHDQPAQAASGNPAAIFHGTVHAADGPHARFTRAAALHAQRVHGALVVQGVPGSVDGLLRAGTSAAPPQAEGWAGIWTAAQLQTRGSGVRADDAWFFPGGGWVDAAAAVRALLAGPGIHFQGRSPVAGLARQGDEWQVLGPAGQAWAKASVVVVAGAGAGAGPSPSREMATLLAQAGAAPWPMGRARGQVSWFDHPSPALPWPVAGGGYALRRPDTRMLLCGATTQADDQDPQPRDADHAFNLARLFAQTGLAPPSGTPVHGRVAWRERAPDRLPVVGAALDAAACEASKLDAPSAARRGIARVPGLFVMSGMAGRGFTWGPLAGEVLASWVDQGPQPLEAELLDALDPARFWLRQQRRAAQAAAGAADPDV